MSDLLHVLQHSLGLDKYGQGSMYRNRFVTGEGSTDYPICKEACSRALMKDYGPQPMNGGMSTFVVTEMGLSFVRANSPKPPKLSRGQLRYRDFLRADCGMTFFEWIKARRAQKERQT